MEDSFTKINQVIQKYAEAIIEDNPQIVAEQAVSYNTFFHNKMLVIRAIKKGMPYKVFKQIQTITPFTESDWASFLNISIKTLHRHKAADNFSFKPIHTEKILELAEVTQLGISVFDSKDQFNDWLHTPSFSLGNFSPAELLQDSYGKDMVMDALYQIENGVFA